MKSEPDVFSIDDLAKAKGKRTHWDGVRNYQARNMLRDDMQIGDEVLYYHSNTDEPAIAGLARVVRTGYPDFTAFDSKDPHFDPKSDPNNPTWYMVDVEFVEKFRQPLTLTFLRSVAALQNMILLRKGSRLSVQPVTFEEFQAVVALAASSR